MEQKKRLKWREMVQLESVPQTNVYGTANPFAIRGWGLSNLLRVQYFPFYGLTPKSQSVKHSGSDLSTDSEHYPKLRKLTPIFDSSSLNNQISLPVLSFGYPRYLKPATSCLLFNREGATCIWYLLDSGKFLPSKAFIESIQKSCCELAKTRILTQQWFISQRSHPIGIGVWGAVERKTPLRGQLE